MHPSWVVKHHLHVTISTCDCALSSLIVRVTNCPLDSAQQAILPCYSVVCWDIPHLHCRSYDHVSVSPSLIWNKPGQVNSLIWSSSPHSILIFIQDARHCRCYTTVPMPVRLSQWAGDSTNQMTVQVPQTDKHILAPMS